MSRTRRRPTRRLNLSDLGLPPALCAALAAVTVALALASPCRGQEGDESPNRAALDRAALRALDEPLADRRARREHAGVIYRTEEGYAHTPAQRSRRQGGFELRLRPGVDYPRGAEVVAIYHTHPRGAGRRADAHSPHDVLVARELGLVSYLGVVESGQVRRYDPDARPRAPLGYPQGAHLGARVAPTERRP